VAGEAYLEGTIRTFDVETQDIIERRMREIFDGTTRAAGASFTLEFDRSHPLTVNDTALARRFDPVLARVAGRANVRQVPPITGAEDFSFFAQQVPGFYIFIGGVPEGLSSGGHHTPTFYVDDQLVPHAMRIMTALVLDALGGTKP
jgi:metal-dependent amidase/aminoacylase/carboxypeptidase family protein